MMDDPELCPGYTFFIIAAIINTWWWVVVPEGNSLGDKCHLCYQRGDTVRVPFPPAPIRHQGTRKGYQIFPYEGGGV